MKKAIITGVGGQDGAYLARYLIDLGYEIYGGYRRAVSPNFWRLNELGLLNEPNFHLVEFELTDPFNILSVVNKIRPEEIYNLAAQSFVGVSFKEPFHTANATGIGTLNILEAIKTVDKSIKFYQASPAKRNDAVLSAFAVWSGKALCTLYHSKLSRKLRYFRLKRHFI